MVVDKDKIILLLKQKGPLVLNDMQKILKGDSIFFGAILSELSSRGMVKITKLKKGSSPFYYLPDQEKLLENLISFLNPKDQKTVLLLKNEKVIQEANQDLLTRVSLRNIPDYSRSFMIKTSNGPYRFWRYYLISEQEAINILKNESTPTKKEPITQQVVSKNINQTKTENSSNEVSKEQEQKNISTEKFLNKSASKNTSSKKSIKENNNLNQQSLSINPSLEKTPFYEKTINYFKETEIVLISEKQISKDREYSFQVKIPSSVGYLDMYAHVRNKKKLTEGDVAPALLNAKNKDLPCLFLTNGEFTKKSLTLMKNDYHGLIIKKL